MKKLPLNEDGLMTCVNNRGEVTFDSGSGPILARIISMLWINNNRSITYRYYNAMDRRWRLDVVSFSGLKRSLEQGFICKLATRNVNIKTR